MPVVFVLSIRAISGYPLVDHINKCFEKAQSPNQIMAGLYKSNCAPVKNTLYNPIYYFH